MTNERWEQLDELGKRTTIGLGMVEEDADKLLKELADVVFEEATGDPAVLRQLALSLSAAAELKLALDEAMRTLMMLRGELGPPPDAAA